MKKLTKILIVIYSIILAGACGLLIYINFINKETGFISNRHLIPVVIVFVLGVAKMINGEFSSNKSLNFYRKSYQDIIKDSFEDDRKSLNLLLKALRCYNKNQFNKAIVILENLLSKCRTNNEKYSVNLFKALVLTDQNQNEEAITIYEDMIFHGYADSRIFSNLMKLYTEIGDYEKAESTGLQAISANPSNYNAHNNLAYLYFSNGAYDEAIKYALQCLKIKNNFVEALTLLFVIFSLQDNLQEAENYKRQAIANGRSAKVLQDTLEFYRG